MNDAGAGARSRESSAAPHAVRNSYAASRADALGLIAECFLAHGATDVAGPDRQLLTIHVEEAVLRDETAAGRCELEEQTSVPPATAERLACDASLIEITENTDGEPLKLGLRSGRCPQHCVERSWLGITPSEARSAAALGRERRSQPRAAVPADERWRTARTHPRSPLLVR